MKKLLSLILATALLIGLVPCAFAADVETGNGNEWVFSVGQHDVSEETLATGNFNSEYGISHFNGTVSDKWGFVNIGGGSEYDPEVDHILYEYNLPEIKSIPEPDTSNAIALELDPDTSGTFNPTITVITETTAPIYEVYLMEKPANSLISVDEGAVIGSKSGFPSFARNLNKSKRLGLIDAYGTGALKTVSFPAVTVDADTNYWLILSPNGANENREGRKATSGGVAYYRATLKLVSFAMKDSKNTSAPFYKYNISSNALSDTFYTDYASTLSGYSNLPSNGMLRYISWETTVSTVATPAIDTTKTDGFATTGRNYKRDTSPTLSDAGFSSHLKVGVYTAATDTTEAITTLYFDEGYNERPFCLLILNVPVGGKYKVTALNAFTEETAKAACSSRATIKNNYVTQGTVATVHMVEATVNCKYDQSGTNNYVNNTALLGFSESSKIGSYDCRVLAASADEPVETEIGIVELSAGKHYIFFDIDSAAGKANSQYWNYKDGLNQLFLLSGIQLTPVSETNVDEIQSSYDSIVNVDAGNAEEKTPANTTSNVKILCGIDKSTLYTDDVAAGSSVTYTAPEKDGYTFLYWAQGIGEYKKIVSYDEDLSVKAEKGPMWLTAVYADNASTKTDVVFYNANGDEISRSQYEENDTIALAALPSMAGFETATGWTLDTDGVTYTSADEVKASGRLMRFVAEYADEPSESFDVTVVNGTADNAAPVYGDTVTVTATLRSGAKLFNYWEKDGEIVSFDLTYSFKAWKDTTVTAVYKDYLPIADTVRKIILGTRMVGTETAVVAEFINVSDVVEKGILFGTSLDAASHKVSMKTDGDTFSVIDDVAGDAIGYAILSNGKVIYSK